MTAEEEEAMAGVDDADVLAAAVLVPVRQPVVSSEAPTARASVAQVDTGRLDWPVHLRQVRHVRSRLVNLLQTATSSLHCENIRLSTNICGDFSTF